MDDSPSAADAAAAANSDSDRSATVSPAAPGFHLMPPLAAAAPGGGGVPVSVLLPAALALAPAALLAQKHAALKLAFFGTAATITAAEKEQLAIEGLLKAQKAKIEQLKAKQQGLDKRCKDELDEWTKSLNAAAKVGNLGLAKTALANGADPNWPAPLKGRSALMSAARLGEVELTRTLLDAGSDPNLARIDNGNTALMSAANHGHLDIARLLLERGADYSLARTDAGFAGFTSLMWASQNGHFGVAKALLDRGAEPNQAKTDTGSTPLMVAAQKGHCAVVELLIDRGALVNTARLDSGRTALVFAAQKGHLDVAKTLIARGAEPNRRKKDGSTALMYAARNGFAALVRLLLDKGAAPNQARTDIGSTALLLAAQHGYLDVCTLLLDRGADPNQKMTNNGFTALMAAAMVGHLSVVQALSVYGADREVKTTDPGAFTALNLAARHGRIGVGNWLRAVRRCSALQIAVNYQLFSAARAALKIGQISPETDLASVTRLVDTARQHAGKFPQGVELVREAMATWAPARHMLYHPTFRHAIRSVITVALRVRTRHGTADAVRRSIQQPDGHTTAGPLPILPAELWIMIGGFLSRGDWFTTAEIEHQRGANTAKGHGRVTDAELAAAVAVCM